jgi:hypothetical protein
MFAASGGMRGRRGRCRDEARIVLWDLWNEPDNPNTSAYGNEDLGPAKAALEAPLLDRAFQWAGPKRRRSR